MVEVKHVTDERTPCALSGEDGNVYAVLGRASRALKRDGRAEAAAEMNKRVMDDARSYDAALEIVLEYVEDAT